jgi:cytochrome c peroxidase
MNIWRSGAAWVVLGVMMGIIPRPAMAADPIAAPVLHLPPTPYRYADLPAPSFYNSNPVRRLDSTPRDNPITDAGATLGRVLFYDTRLSANNTVSCASCHQQAHAFSDPRRFSVGFGGKPTDRHSMPLVDLRYYGRGRYFWDERAGSLEAQVLMPIQNGTEMGQDLSRLQQLLAADGHYPTLFRQAFGDSSITSPRIAAALAQFARSLVSYRSKFDRGLGQARAIDRDFDNFSQAENRGKQVFLNRCAVCHLPPGQGVIFSSQQAQNNGLDLGVNVPDLGLADVTFNRFEAGDFKAPSLRNIEYTGPYMHDGRFATLEQVVEHYSSGVKNHPNLDRRVGPPGGRRLSPADKAALVAFLKTLSDPEFIRDPRFADPFERKAAPPAPRSIVRNAVLNRTNSGESR